MTASLFASDLGNTVIYSRRKPHEGFACVGWAVTTNGACLLCAPGTLFPEFVFTKGLELMEGLDD